MNNVTSVRTLRKQKVMEHNHSAICFINFLKRNIGLYIEPYKGKQITVTL